MTGKESCQFCKYSGPKSSVGGHLARYVPELVHVIPTLNKVRKDSFHPVFIARAHRKSSYPLNIQLHGTPVELAIQRVFGASASIPIHSDDQESWSAREHYKINSDWWVARYREIVDHFSQHRFSDIEATRRIQELYKLAAASCTPHTITNQPAVPADAMNNNQRRFQNNGEWNAIATRSHGNTVHTISPTIRRRKGRRTVLESEEDDNKDFANTVFNHKMARDPVTIINHRCSAPWPTRRYTHLGDEDTDGEGDPFPASDIVKMRPTIPTKNPTTFVEKPTATPVKKPRYMDIRKDSHSNLSPLEPINHKSLPWMRPLFHLQVYFNGQKYMVPIEAEMMLADAIAQMWRLAPAFLRTVSCDKVFIDRNGDVMDDVAWMQQVGEAETLSSGSVVTVRLVMCELQSC